jgi:hypothetical protein
MSDSNHQPLTSRMYLRAMIFRATMTLAICAFAAIPAATAQTFSVIYSFGATTTDGITPEGKLVLDDHAVTDH